MTRKDCDTARPAHIPDRRNPSFRWSLAALGLTWIAAAVAPAGNIRVWSSAVVVDDDVRLSDVGEIRGFDAATEKALSELVVTTAPRPGGSRFVHMEMIRSALSAGGTNMAWVTVSGATRCAVTRPSRLATQATAAPPSASTPTHSGGVSRSSRTAPDGKRPVAAPLTLRRAVIDFFHDELKRRGGRAEVVFDRASQPMLDLSGPSHTFRVRRRGSRPLGLVQMEVEVLAGGKIVQVVPIVVQVAMIRPTVVARRPINQGATVRASDVEVVSRTLTRLRQLGLTDPAMAIGQRAKRFIPVGGVIAPDTLESVPLVERGQLVSLVSVAGGVEIVTSAKAMEQGRLGDLISVRSTENKRVEFDAVVVGPGSVRIGPPAGVEPDRVAAVTGASR